MAKIFYCGGLLGKLGTLRAVVPVANLHNVLSNDELKYVGKSFPTMRDAGAVIEIVADEHGIWKSGFYHTAQTPTDFEQHLRGL